MLKVYLEITVIAAPWPPLRRLIVCAGLLAVRGRGAVDRREHEVAGVEEARRLLLIWSTRLLIEPAPLVTWTLALRRPAWSG